MTSWDQEWETARLRRRHPPKHSAWGSAKQPWLMLAKVNPCLIFITLSKRQRLPHVHDPILGQHRSPFHLWSSARLEGFCPVTGEDINCCVFLTSDQLPMCSPHPRTWLFNSQAWTFARIRQSGWGHTQPDTVRCSLGFQHKGLFLAVSGQLAPFLPARFLCAAPHQSHTNDISEL